ncbi:AAA family ATPase, partial [Glaesserella parasuis]|nr:AAA family ATPase [Glaesserella parasuis]
ISRIIANHSAYAGCQINWQNSIPVKTIVYNSDFVRDNFTQSQNIKGVFTLGENQVEIENQINVLEKDLDNIDKDITQKNNTHIQKNNELKSE